MYIIQQAYLEPSAHIQTAHVSIHSLATQQMMAYCLTTAASPHLHVASTPYTGSLLCMAASICSADTSGCFYSLSSSHSSTAITIPQHSLFNPLPTVPSHPCITIPQYCLPTFPSHPCITVPQHSLFNPLPTCSIAITVPQKFLFNTNLPTCPYSILLQSIYHNILCLTLSNLPTHFPTVPVTRVCY